MLINATEVTGNNVNAGDVFVTADRNTVTFERVLGVKVDGDNVNVALLGDTFDGNRDAVSLSDISLSTLSADDTVSVVRA